MIGKTVNATLKILGLLVLAAAAAVLLLAWRVSSGPISLEFARPHIQDALTPPGQPLRVEIGEPVLTWRGWRRLFDISIRDIRVSSPDGSIEVEAPEASILLSAGALAAGRAEPARVSAEGARIRLALPAGGDGENGPADPLALAALLGAAGASGGAEGGIAGPGEIELTGASIEIAPPGRPPLAFEGANATLRRRGADLDIAFAAAARTGGGAFGVDLEARRAGATGRTDGTLALKGVPLALAAQPWPELSKFVALAAPADATAEFRLSPGLEPVRADISLAAAAGDLALPALDPRPLAFDRLALAASWDATAGTAEVGSLEVRFGPSTLSASATVRDISGRAAVKGEATLRDFPVDGIGGRWPPGLGGNARAWVESNLEGGTVSAATMRFSGALDLADPSGFALRELGGEIDFAGTAAHYRRPLPPATGAEGRAIYDERGMEIDIAAARLEGIDLAGTRVRLLDLDRGLPRAEIEVRARGPLRAALGVLDHESIRLAERVGLDPAGIDGAGDATLRLAFPLLARLRLEEVAYSVEGRLEGVGAPDIAAGRPLSGADLTLALDGDGMRIAGTGAVDGRPATVALEETFAPGDGPRRLQTVKTRIDGADLRAMGLPDLAPIEGSAGVEAELAEHGGGRAEARIALDLREARVEIPALDWRKPAGAAGGLRLALDLRDGELAAVRSASLAAGDLRADFGLEFDPPGGALRRARIDAAKLGTDDARGTIEAIAGGPYAYRAALRGSRLDLRRFLRGAGPGEGGPGPGFTAEARFDELVVADDLPPVADARLSLKRDGTGDSDLRLDGLAGGNPVSLDYRNRGGDRTFEARGEDAGRLLRGLGLVESMRGGRLRLAGKLAGGSPGRRMAGNLAIEEFELVGAPLLARLLGAASLTGLLDILRGNGIRFERLDADIATSPEEVAIRELLASGPSLGISASGRYDRTRGVVEIDGMIVPINLLSRALDRIPILGRALTGGEKEGLFATQFLLRGPLDDPRVTINPLTALAPGFLRDLFKARGGAARRAAPPGDG